MLLLSSARPALLVLALGLLAGCSAWKVNSLAEQLQVQGPEATLQGMQAVNVPDRDRAQYLLDLGSLKFATGDFSGSIEDLQQAKQIMRDAQALSITETAAAATINETFRVYDGTPSERVLVHYALALNYLAANDFDGARVEVLQADVLMQELAKDDSPSGQLASLRFLAGIIYELGGEWDDAMISYRRAAAIMKARGQRIPPALASSLLNTSYRQGFKEEYQGYEKEFKRSSDLAKDSDGEIILFYHDGIVSTVKQKKISVYSWQAEQMISIAVPYYPPVNYYPSPIGISVAGRTVSTAPVENIEVLVREDLEAAMPGIIATTTARAAAKYYAVKQANNQDNWAGLIANIVTMASELADTRSWNMLPSNLQVARIKVPAGATAEIEGIPATAYDEQLAAASKGGSVIVMLSSLRNNVYSYHQIR